MEEPTFTALLINDGDTFERGTLVTVVGFVRGTLGLLDVVIVDRDGRLLTEHAQNVKLVSEDDAIALHP